MAKYTLEKEIVLHKFYPNGTPTTHEVTHEDLQKLYDQMPTSISADHWLAAQAALEKLVYTKWEAIAKDFSWVEGNHSKRIQARPPLWDTSNAAFWWAHPSIKGLMVHAPNTDDETTAYVINIGIYQ